MLKLSKFVIFTYDRLSDILLPHCAKKNHLSLWVAVEWNNNVSAVQLYCSEVGIWNICIYTLTYWKCCLQFCAILCCCFYAILQWFQSTVAQISSNIPCSITALEMCMHKHNKQGYYTKNTIFSTNISHKYVSSFLLFKKAFSFFS